MGHLLETVNPAAAAAIQPQPGSAVAQAAERLEPGVTVQYFARPGEGRGGKMVFPAIVQFHGERGVELIVFHAADDIATRTNLPQRTPDTPYNCWDFVPVYVEGDAADALARQEIGTLKKEVEDLRHKLATLLKRATENVTSAGSILASQKQPKSQINRINRR